MSLINKKDTYLKVSGTTKEPDKRHLHIIITSPCPQGRVVVVSVCSWTNSLCDSSCVLEAGEHSFLKKKSYVYYRKARIEDSAVIEASLSRRIYLKKEQVSGLLLTRIRNGLVKSELTPRSVLSYFHSIKTTC